MGCRSISSLENDMAAIHSEHDTQNRRLLAQKSALDGVISDLAAVNVIINIDKEAVAAYSPMQMPALDIDGLDVAMENGATSSRAESAMGLEEAGETGEVEKEDGEYKDSDTVTTSLSAAAEAFVPEKSPKGVEDDIEMGEVAEDHKIKGKKVREEELEEGEASDSSSALSDPPDD